MPPCAACSPFTRPVCPRTLSLVDPEPSARTAPALLRVQYGHYDGHSRINLREVFLSVQNQMLACLAMGDAFENPSACGSASEQRWIDLFTPLSPPALWRHTRIRRGCRRPPQPSNRHYNLRQSVLAPDFPPRFRPAHRRRKRVRDLRSQAAHDAPTDPRRRPQSRVGSILAPHVGSDHFRFSTPDEAPIFFVIRLMERLRALGTAPAADLMEYGRALESLGPFREAA